MDIAQYSPESRELIKRAQDVAGTLRHPEIDVEHLLIATVRSDNPEVSSILSQIGKSPAFIEDAAERYLKDQSRRSAPQKPTVGPAVQEVLKLAIDEKARAYAPLVEPEHVLLAIFDPKSKLAPQVRENVDLTKEDLEKALADVKSVSEITGPAEGKAATGESTTTAAEAGRPGRGLKFCTDMTGQAASGEFDPVIGRDPEIQQTIQILLRRRKNSPVLVGGAGVGKSAVVEGLAQAIVDEKVPKALRDCRLMEVDIGAMVAGAKYKGEFEERFKALMSEVIKTAGKVILFIDEIHMIAGAGGGGGMDAANLLKPPLARGQVKLIGATTQEEYTKYLEKDKALERRFEKVKIDQPDVDVAIRIVKGVLDKYQKHHDLTYTQEAAVAAVKYGRRYLSERNLPDICLDLIDEAGSEFSVKEEFAREAIPELEKGIAEFESLLAKAKEDSEEDVESTREAYEELCRGLDRLDSFWGHRIEAQQKEAE